MILQGRSFRFEIYLPMIAEFMLLDYMTKAFKKNQCEPLFLLNVINLLNIVIAKYTYRGFVPKSNDVSGHSSMSFTF